MNYLLICKKRLNVNEGSLDEWIELEETYHEDMPGLY